MFTKFNCLKEKTKTPQEDKIKKGLDLSKSWKVFPENIVHDYLYQLAEFHAQLIYNSKYILNNILYKYSSWSQIFQLI